MIDFRDQEPAYLGDGVYAVVQQGCLVLTTGTHDLSAADAVVYIDPDVLRALLRYIDVLPPER